VLAKANKKESIRSIRGNARRSGLSGLVFPLDFASSATQVRSMAITYTELNFGT